MELRTTDGVTRWRLDVADSWFKRFKGLMGRAALPDGRGLYLPGANGIHMFFMRFPIDCVFVGARRPDGSRQIVAIHERLAPWRGIVWWVRGAHGVAEVPAGSVSSVGLELGDVVDLRGLS